MKISRRMQGFGLFTLVFTTLIMLILHFTPARGWPMLEHYALPLIFAFVGAVIMRQQKIRWDYVICALTLVWFIISRMLLGELYLQNSWEHFCRLAICYLLAFPFAFGAGDQERKIGLKCVAWIYLIVMFVIAVLSLMVAVFGQPIQLPMVENGTIYIHDWEKRLYAPKHPLTTASLFLVALMLGFWQLCNSRRLWIIVPGTIMCLCIYAAIGLTVSRTVMIQTALCAGFIGVAFVMHRRIPKVWIKVLACAAAFVVLLVCGYLGFSLTNHAVWKASESIPVASAETVQNTLVASRPLMADMATLTGRTGIYKGFFDMLRDHPLMLLLGGLQDRALAVLNHYTPFYVDHAHNAYLEVLLYLGLPGLLIAVYLVIRALWLSFKVVFLQKSSFADKLLAAFTVSLLVITITEPYPFTRSVPLYNFFFFLIFGYLAETERSLRVKKA